MNATATRRETAVPGRIVELTQHWTLAAGAYYRDVLVELPDGSLWIYPVRDDLVSVAA